MKSLIFKLKEKKKYISSKMTLCFTRITFFFQIFPSLLPNFTSVCQIPFKYANIFSALTFFPHYDFPDHFGKCVMNQTFTVLCS